MTDELTNSRECEVKNSELLLPSDAPLNETIWAKVRGKDKEFWALAEYTGCGDWVGLHTWDSYLDDSSFRDYGWEVVGWLPLNDPN